MNGKIRAKIVNGALVPLEPLGIEEGVVVELRLCVDSASAPKDEPDKAKFRVTPNHSALLPGMDDPKRMHHILEDEDIEHYLRVQEFGRGA